MQVSFIVTSYNIECFIMQCLQSLCETVVPGDQVIVVDDGSRDETVQQIKTAFSNLTWPKNVELCPVFLDQNTPGGVGIGANIGLSHASRDAVFFVDGDDWLASEGVKSARQAFEHSGADILLANYQVFDMVEQQAVAPSDAHIWEQNFEGFPLEITAARSFALEMNSVPWRKFYARRFLTQHNVRFPEGDFFFEDNPFHWAVCLRAHKIVFHDSCVAFHRLNRVGQTMSDAGHGFAAMFTHYETILADVAQFDDAELIRADRWLATNMAWQLERISQAAFPAYAMAAEMALCGVHKERWLKMCDGVLATHEVGHLLATLLTGGARGLFQAWQPWQMLRRFEAHRMDIDKRLRVLESEADKNASLIQEARNFALGARNYSEFLVLDLKNEP